MLKSCLALLKCGDSRSRRTCLKRLIAFIGGFILGQIYYFYLLKKIPFPGNFGIILSFIISIVLGVGNVICVQLRCISWLTLPMYCGMPGRGLLKVIVLTYVIAGPITNMGLNAQEVVRVFACSTELTYNLTREKYLHMGAPFKRALIGMRPEITQIKDTIRLIRDVITPVECEIEDRKTRTTLQNNYQDYFSAAFENASDDRLLCKGPSKITSHVKGKEAVDEVPLFQENLLYQDMYVNKLERRCKSLISRATAYCTQVLSSAYKQCLRAVPRGSSWALCRPLNLTHVCNIDRLIEETGVCDGRKQTNPGLGEGYVALKMAKRILTDDRQVAMQYKLNIVRNLYDIQDAKETGVRVMHAFEQKYATMQAVVVAVNAFVALLFLRIFSAAVTYHDQYLTNIEYDNVYVTKLFKRIDQKRRRRQQYTLLPLKKMERNKYTDVQSSEYSFADREKLLLHVLKLSLEVVTATTFVMLDRLFYEALDVVRQHAETQLPAAATRDLEIEVTGTGTVANMVRKVLDGLNIQDTSNLLVSNRQCLPRPSFIPFAYYLKIYGGYLWILVLLYMNPYTIRLKRFICRHFYPCREKQRILHLYNDILKKRMKMQKTLRKKAAQAVRAHYLSGENLRSLRMKFPRLLNWLRVIPAARMTCLICGETEPGDQHNPTEPEWHWCSMSKCPFVCCVECWREAGARCLACEPGLTELSDVDSLTDDDFKY